MFNWLKRGARGSRRVGLDVYADGFALAVIDAAESAAPRIVAVNWCSLEGVATLTEALTREVRKHSLAGLPTVVTLPHAAYSLVQLEAPDLEAEELRDAMRWRVKDLIDFPVEQAEIDIFRLPESHRPGAPALMYVVVARHEAVKQLVQAVIAAGLEIEAVDVVEMAIRNLSMNLDRPQRPRAYLHLQPGQTVIEIADGENIYLSRRVMQDYDRDADMALLGAQMENLALEVQRSMDYFESQFALGPVDRLSVIVCDDTLYQAFADIARSFLTVPAERFSFSEVALAPGIELATLGRGVTAVGAAMRGMRWAA
ncbi:MAG: pilus assembly protein PilM [Gammaproteobacteria bacterium]|nr:pilus assembly protein PilM [Gammaproteobacteria bacterium]